MKKYLILLLLILLLSGCRKKEVIEEINEPVPETSDHKIGVHFSGVDPIEQMISDYEKKTGGKLFFSRPEYGYYEFTFEGKTDEDMNEIVNETNQLNYVMNSDLDTEFIEPEIESNTNQDSEIGEWTLPEY